MLTHRRLIVLFILCKLTLTSMFTVGLRSLQLFFLNTYLHPLYPQHLPSFSSNILFPVHEVWGGHTRPQWHVGQRARFFFSLLWLHHRFSERVVETTDCPYLPPGLHTVRPPVTETMLKKTYPVAERKKKRGAQDQRRNLQNLGFWGVGCRSNSERLPEASPLQLWTSRLMYGLCRLMSGGASYTLLSGDSQQVSAVHFTALSQTRWKQKSIRMKEAHFSSGRAAAGQPSVCP